DRHPSRGCADRDPDPSAEGVGGHPQFPLAYEGVGGHPQFPLAIRQTIPPLVRLTIMTQAGSTSDRPRHREPMWSIRAWHGGTARKSWLRMRSGFIIVFSGSCAGPSSGGSIRSRAIPTITAEPGFGTAWSRWRDSSAW